MALTTLKSIQSEIKQLEERKKLVEKRDNDVPKALAILHTYAQVLTPAQRRQVARIMGDTVDLPAAAPRKAAKATKKAKRSTGKVAPKYQLATGELWTGRGRTPLAYGAWSKSAEGKAWQKANPDQLYPPAPGATAANKPVKKAVKKAAKAAKPANKAPARKKAVKKTTRKAAKKA